MRSHKQWAVTDQLEWWPGVQWPLCQTQWHPVYCPQVHCPDSDLQTVVSVTSTTLGDMCGHHDDSHTSTPHHTPIYGVQIPLLVKLQYEFLSRLPSNYVFRKTKIRYMAAGAIVVFYFSKFTRQLINSFNDCSSIHLCNLKWEHSCESGTWFSTCLCVDGVNTSCSLKNLFAVKFNGLKANPWRDNWL